MSQLFSEFRLKTITLKNRIVVSPMCQYSAEDGVPNDWHLVHLGARAVGGAALVIAEATAVSPEGRITPGCTGLWNDQQAEAWAPIAKFVKSKGALAGILLHVFVAAGYKALLALIGFLLLDEVGITLEREEFHALAPGFPAFGIRLREFKLVIILVEVLFLGEVEGLGQNFLI